MRIDWTTFILEVVNFLVLVWILKRFLYRPVLDVLNRRRAAVENTLAEAKAVEERAAGLRAQYENRLADWEKEKGAARAEFDAEMASERARALRVLEAELARERERVAVLEERKRKETLQELEIQAMAQAGRFVSGLLSRLSSPELETRLVSVFVEELATLPEDRVAGLQTAAGEKHARAGIASAFSLSGEEKERIGEALAARMGVALPMDFTEDASLLTGLRVSVGPWRLNMNLADELDFFTAVPGHAG